MEKELIITALVILLIYFYYHSQNKSIITIKNPINSQLQAEVNYYQNLYQQRIEKEVGNAEKINNLEAQLTLLEEMINKPYSHTETQTELSEEKDLEKTLNFLITNMQKLNSEIN